MDPDASILEPSKVNRHIQNLENIWEKYQFMHHHDWDLLDDDDLADFTEHEVLYTAAVASACDFLESTPRDEAARAAVEAARIVAEEKAARKATIEAAIVAAEEAARISAEEEAARLAAEEAAAEAARIAAAEAADKAVEEEATRLATDVPIQEDVTAAPGLCEEAVKMAEVMVSDLL